MANGKIGSPAPVTADLAGGEDPSGNIQSLQLDANKNLKVTGSITATNPSVGTNGQTAPTSSTEIGIIDSSGNLQGASATNPVPVTVTNQPANPATSTLQTAGNTSLASIVTNTTGLATASAQTTGNNSLASIVTNTTGLATASAQTTGNSSLSTIVTNTTGLATASAQTTGNSSLATIATNTTGLATASAQTTGNTSLASIVTDLTNGSQKTQVVDGSGNVQPSGDVASRALFEKITDGTNTMAVKAASTAAAATDPAAVVSLSPNSPLPAGSNAIGSVTVTGTVATTQAASAGVANAPVQNIYSSTNITTSAYTQLIASTTSAATYVDIFDSSGQAMILATGAMGSETILYYVPPGGDQIKVSIAAGTRVAYKALSANATSGYLLLNLLK